MSATAKNSHCFVPGCKTGYRNKASSDTKIKCSLFSPSPKNLLLWSKSIPRADKQLSLKDRVCEIHFERHHIIHEDKFTVGGETVTLPRERPRLHTDAVPCIFPNLPQYLSRKVAKPRRKLVKHDTIRQSDTETVGQYNVTSCNNNGTSSELGQQMGFSDLRNCHLDIAAQCPPGWVSRANESVVCFGKIVLEDSCLQSTVNVSISSEEEVSVLSKNRKLPFGCKLQSQIQLMELIHKVNSMSECCGATGLGSEFLNTAIQHSTLGVYDDKAKKWWHTNCCGIVETDNQRCLPCKRMRKILQAAHKMKERRSAKVRKHLVCARKVRQSQQRIVKLRDSVSTLRKKLAEQSELCGIDLYISDLPENQQIGIRQALKHASVRSARGMRYNEKWLLSCILLRIKSPKAYSHLRDHQILSLPSRSTLQRYMDVVRAQCGVSQECLNLLKEKVSTRAERHGILIMDEVKLRVGVKFSVRDLKFSGLIDLGEFTSTKDRKNPADYGLVFMYRPFMGSWTQTVAMFLSKGPTKSAILSKLMVKVIMALESLHLWVDAVVCDGGATNRGMWKEFGISGRLHNAQNSVQHPCPSSSTDADRRLFFLSDYVHLVKCIRNNLLNRKFFHFQDGVVKRQHYIDLHRLDSMNGGLKVAPKLTEAHINPNNLQRMNVRLAVQLFSNSTADALQFYTSTRMLSDTDTTVSFTRRINRLFDILNSKKPFQGLKLESSEFAFLESSLSWLDAWETHVACLDSERKNQCLSPSTFQGLRVTLLSTIQLSQYLLMLPDAPFAYILTSRFGQDPLEHFFGLLRHAAGCDDHPTATMFVQLYRLLSVYSLLRLPRRRINSYSNQQLCHANLRINPVKVTKRQAAVSMATECIDSLVAFVSDENPVDAVDVPPLATLSVTTKDNIVFYVAGFVIKHCLKVLHCSSCISAVSGDRCQLPQSTLINIKLRGSLHWPSEALFLALREAEEYISSHLADGLDPEAFTELLGLVIPVFLPLRSKLCSPHASSVCAEIATYYIVTRLHWHVKEVSQIVKTSKSCKQLRKKAKLC